VALALGQELEDASLTAGAYRALGDVARRRGDLDRAAALLREGLVRFLERRRAAEAPGDATELTTWLDRLALVALGQQQVTRAARLLGAAAALREAKEERPDALDRLERDEVVHVARTAVGEVGVAAARTAGRALTPEQAIAEALRDEPATAPEGPPVRLGATTALYDLTPREVEVLRLLAQGATDRAIAQHLNISIKTVNKHVASILGKTGSPNRTAAAAVALHHRLVTPSDPGAASSDREARPPE
jgi:DNA-binding CsgD family transcriptional regulator